MPIFVFLFSCQKKQKTCLTISIPVFGSGRSILSPTISLAGTSGLCVGIERSPCRFKTKTNRFAKNSQKRLVFVFSKQKVSNFTQMLCAQKMLFWAWVGRAHTLFSPAQQGNSSVSVLVIMECG